MLAKENRIRLNKEFDRVFKSGQSFYGKTIGLRVAANSLLSSRFGIMLGLKVSKRAVIRNRLRRQIRAIISQEMKLIKEGYDIVFIVLPAIIDQDFLVIEKIVKNSLKRAGLYK